MHFFHAYPPSDLELQCHIPFSAIFYPPPPPLLPPSPLLPLSPLLPRPPFPLPLPPCLYAVHVCNVCASEEEKHFSLDLMPHEENRFCAFAVRFSNDGKEVVAS